MPIKYGERQMSKISLNDLLNPLRKTEVVDVGANPIDGDPPYKYMLELGLCNVTGFEPQIEALQVLKNNAGNFETYLPYVVGASSLKSLNICLAPGMSSLFEPDFKKLKVFNELAQLAQVVDQVPVTPIPLDDISELISVDFLKIDIQGGELGVFQTGREKLSSAVAIQTEISFITLYKEQPTLGDIDQELRKQGFIPHCFAAIKNWPIAPCVVNNNPRQALNQLIEADLVYVRDYFYEEQMSDEQLKHLALLSHYLYKSYDLTLRCLLILEQRGAVSSGTQQAYLQNLS
jgi:FkbM family methyltransferase